MKQVGLIVFLFLGLSIWGYAAEVGTSADRDSLYVTWNKTKSALPVVYMNLPRFEDAHDRSVVMNLALNYGIGAIYISDGDRAQVKKWIQVLEREAVVATLVAAKASGVFELPFDGLGEMPEDEIVSCLTDLDLVRQLAEANAATLQDMGVDVLHYDQLPVYFDDLDVQKTLLYWSVLKDSGVSLSFGNGTRAFVSKYREQINWENVLWLESGAVADHVLTKKKPSRAFRKQTKFEGLVIESLDRKSLEDHKKNQWNRGVDVLWSTVNNGSPYLVEQLLHSEVAKKSYFKTAVKKYYQHWHSIQLKPNTIYPTTERFSDRMIYAFKSKAITLIKDEVGYFPIQNLMGYPVYSFSSHEHQSVMGHTMDLYKSGQHYSLDELSAYCPDSAEVNIPLHSHVIVDLSSVFRVSEIQYYVSLIESLADTYQIGVIYQGHWSNLRYLMGLETLLWTPEHDSQSMELMVQVAFGAVDVSGTLPAYLGSTSERMGVSKKSLGRLQYMDPVLLGIDVRKLDQIDSIVAEGIKDQMFPGCQIMMVKDGAVVYQKSFGYLTYDSLVPVAWDHIYDIASITKTAATVPMIMQEVAQGHLDLNGRLGDFSARFSETDKSDLIVSDMLTHQSGLRSYLPFWKNSEFLIDSAAFYYKKEIKRKKYEYMSVNWEDSISTWIGSSTYNSLKNPDNTYRYLYSDLGFMIMKDAVEEREKMGFDRLVDSLFYNPLSMDHTSYNPLRYFSADQIAPTEQDDSFRHDLLRGQVHDRNAALLGGVSGHAGLFSNSNDLAKYMQMMMQGGYYGGKQYFDPALVQLFTEKTDPKYSRALGWDKPRQAVGNTSKYASERSFGHSGFTGTLVWADPENDLVYVFLSNRVYPDPNNYKLIKSNTRTKIHDLMYESILSGQKVVNHQM
ncbi:serine hydrolase domain-containing protein [Reichenbachiella agariperforans]|nr:serine hydrolase [Reichenbachiella agariperforans]